MNKPIAVKFLRKLITALIISKMLKEWLYGIQVHVHPQFFYIPRLVVNS